MPSSCPSSHRCNWCCHQNFNNNNCPILCGDRCIHLYCTNCCRPDLFPPPNPTPLLSTWFLSLSKQLQLLFLVSTNNLFGYLLHNPSILPTSRHSSILLTPMASSIIHQAELSLVAPLPIRLTPLEEIESMQLRYPLESLSTDLRDSSPIASLPTGADIGSQTDMEFAMLAKILDPIQYDPFLMQDVLFPCTIPRPTGFQQWDDLTCKDQSQAK